MIISKKKFNEKIQEAINQVDKERWIHDRIDRVDRDNQERIQGIFNHLSDIERRVAELEGEKEIHGGAKR